MKKTENSSILVSRALWILIEFLLLYIQPLQVKPAVIVDKAIELFLDVVVPGRGAGVSNW
jgi:hypothetical protein